ncbi:MAG: PA2779 family protein [Campylobacterales bacterium]|nr:PA2779 family protein [Campylobacterales bacterium]
MKIAKIFLSLVISITLFSTTLFAESVSTKEVLGQIASSKIDTFLAKQEVADKLSAMGVSKDELKERLSSLSSDEVAKINSKIDEMPAGGDAGAIVGVLAFIFVLLIVTDVLGFTKVFTFTRSVR